MIIQIDVRATGYKFTIKYLSHEIQISKKKSFELAETSAEPERLTSLTQYTWSYTAANL